MQSNAAEINRLKNKQEKLDTTRSQLLSAQQGFEQHQSDRKIRLTGVEEYTPYSPLAEQYLIVAQAKLTGSTYTNVDSLYQEAISTLDAEIKRTEDLLATAQRTPIPFQM